MADNSLEYGRFARRAALLAGTIAGFVAVAGPGQASTVAFDLGNQSATTAASPGGTTAVCNQPGANPCVFGDQGASNQFTAGTEIQLKDITSGVVLGADAYNSTGAGTYVTQKPGTFGTAETGIGQSTSGTSLSDSDGEVTNNTYLLLRPVTANYTIAGIWITSMQANEGVKVYGYTGAYSSTSLNLSDLTLLNAMCGGPGTTDCSPVGQTTNSSNPSVELLESSSSVSPASPSASVNSSLGSYNPIVNAALATYSALVVQAFGTGNGGDPNIAVSSVVLASLSGTGTGVPEPASLALLGSGLLGLAVLRRRRRT